MPYDRPVSDHLRGELPDGGGPRPLPPTRLALPPSRTALLVVDLQNYDAHPACGLGPILRATDPGAADYFYGRVAALVVPGVRRLMAAFRARGERVLYCQSGALLADGSDLFARRRARFLGTADGRRTIFHRGETEYEILESLRPEPGDVVLHKSTVSAFNSSSLDRVLRNMGVESLVLAGVVTDGCVDSTARDGSDLGYDCVLVDDACAAWSPAWHAGALQAFERYFGVVATVDQVMAGLGHQSDRPGAVPPEATARPAPEPAPSR
jgi:nicotinamidase-related amidase